MFFDNLQGTHIRRPLIEETHYYPFGLQMVGIGGKALDFGDPANKKKYNGIEYDSTFGIDEDEAQLRNLDPQVGRWWEIDPKIDKMEMWSPYASNFDNPITYSDPLGDEGETCCLGNYGQLTSAVVKALQWVGDRMVYTYHDWEEPALKQAGHNIKTNWQFGNDPIHEAVANPIGAVFPGEGEAVNLAEKAARADGNLLGNTENLMSRKGALNELKRDVGVPRSQHPDQLPNGKQFEKVPMTDRNGKVLLDKNGKPVTFREYTYTKPDGSKVIVQDHSAGHPQFGENNPGGHFNVRPPENKRTGKVPGTKEHYQFRL